MICWLVRLALPLHAAGDLGGRPASWVESHLSRCPACAAERHRWQQSRHRLRDLAASAQTALPPGLREVILTELWRSPRRSVPSSVLRWATAAALVVVPVGMVALFYLAGSSTRPMPAVPVAVTPDVPAPAVPGSEPGLAADQGSAEPELQGLGAPAVPVQTAAVAGQSRPANHHARANLAPAPRKAPKPTRAKPEAHPHVTPTSHIASVGFMPDAAQMESPTARAAMPSSTSEATSAVQPTSAEEARILSWVMRRLGAGAAAGESTLPLVESLTYPVGDLLQVEVPSCNAVIIWVIPKKES